MAERPKVVCLCGSTRFREAYEQASRRETLDGKIVLSVGLFGHQEAMDMGGPIKAMLDELHLRKVDLADEVLVIDPKTNCCNKCSKPCEVETIYLNGVGYNARSACCKAAWTYRAYIGESTRRAIAYARSLGKPIRWLEPAAAEE
jgi:hypothetical protein